MTKKDLIKLLNIDLSKEYSAAVQYIQHAAKITGAEFQTIQEELIIHANEEIGHAIILAEQINYLGGDPTVFVDKRNVSNDTRKMLEQDLFGEIDAIKRYRARVAQAEQLGEYGLKCALVDILIMEEEHERDLQAALGL